MMSSNETVMMQSQKQYRQRGQADALAIAKAIWARTVRLCLRLAFALNSKLSPAPNPSIESTPTSARNLTRASTLTTARNLTCASTLSTALSSGSASTLTSAPNPPRASTLSTALSSGSASTLTSAPNPPRASTLSTALSSSSASTVNPILAATSIFRLAPVLALALGLGFLPVGTAGEDEVQRDPVEWGREIAYGAGNCSSCHAMSTDESDTLSGNLGPVLVAMRVRYPNFEQLRAQIYNAASKNPTSTMPPYGSHKILTEEEIDAVTAFVWEL
ncbi:MAG: sulfur oxidation c-type cytochrome SoxX [Gammaproteobacteria bacterium]|nr:sulfur oxidation c-type cytochrome SoxX [Gammaproteobacteria bacterium]